jgi:PAS domain S-box-containing protein
MSEKLTYEELEQPIQELEQAEYKRKSAEKALWESEKALRESEIKYRAILETTSEGCWILNPELETIEVNESLCKMLGYNRDEMVGKTLFEFVDDENRKIFIGQTSKISNIDHRSYEITLKKKNGEDIHTFFNATTIKEAGRCVELQQLAHRQLTTRKQEVQNENLSSKRTQKC